MRGGWGFPPILSPLSVLPKSGNTLLHGFKSLALNCTADKYHRDAIQMDLPNSYSAAWHTHERVLRKMQTPRRAHINWVIVAKGFICLPVSHLGLLTLSSSLGCSDLEGDVEPPPSKPLRPALLRAGPEQWLPALIKTSETAHAHSFSQSLQECQPRSASLGHPQSPPNNSSEHSLWEQSISLKLSNTLLWSPIHLSRAQFLLHTGLFLYIL